MDGREDSGEKIRKRVGNYSFPDHAQYTRVANLIDEGGNWNSNLIWRLFKRKDAESILSIHIPKGYQKDTLMWAGTKNSAYSVKSAYWFLQHGNEKSHRSPNI